MSKLLDRIVKFAFDNIDLPKGEKKHFTFLCDKSKILNIGYNNYYKSHPFSQKLGYGVKFFHSELSCLLPYRGEFSNLRGLTLINIRVNTQNEIRMSKPCNHCLAWLRLIDFRRIIYSDFNGNFVTLEE